MYSHSVHLEADRCRGCTACIKRCPAEAIRVRHGKAKILEMRCVDCGECVRICPSQAKVAMSDPLGDMDSFSRSIALVAPSFYGQFPVDIPVGKIHNALKNLGFRDVIDVALAAELITRNSRKWLKQFSGSTAITSSCPVVVRLIQNRFPSLIDSLITEISPMELAARYARSLYPGEDTGVFFLSPCSAKLTAAHAPRGVETSQVDRVIGFNQVYGAVKQQLSDSEDMPVQTGALGIGWAAAGGEGRSSGTSYLRIDGINEVIAGLEKLENGSWEEYDLVEFMSCPGGCLGGPLTVLNPAESRAILAERRKKMPPEVSSLPEEMLNIDSRWERKLESQKVYQLHENYEKALGLMEQMEHIRQGLPGIDCGSCGAPTCRSLAEDVVRGKALETDCIFKQRERIRSLTDEMVALQKLLPPSMG